MKFFLTTIIASLIFLLFPSYSFAQNNPDIPRNEFQRGKVVKVLEEGKKKVLDKDQPYQLLEVKVTTGEDKDKVFKIDHGANTTIKEFQLLNAGDEVVLMKLGSGDTKEYFIQDRYRLPGLIIIFLGFFALVVILSRLRGVLSFAGMLVSLAILMFFIIPSIARGGDPVLYTLLGSTAIIFISIYLAHGFNKRTTIAVGSTFIALLIAVAISYAFSIWAHLTGSGSEDAYALQFGQFANINLRGLLLAGIIIGTLGVLDDITTSLTAAVEELSKANEKFTKVELYKRGISIGREHISSLVNTLVLAYAGASMPVFLFFLAIKDTQPIWVTLNSEFLVEEIVRALVGSTALILAVPITTFFAAAIYGKKN